MNDVEDNVLPDVEAIAAPDDASLVSVAALAREQLEAERRVAVLEAQLKAARAELAAVAEDRLPTAMTALGLADFRLDTGARVEVRQAYRCGQLDDGPDDPRGKKRPAAERREALAWLDEHGHGALARRTITVTLGRDNEALARELLDLLRRHPSANRLVIDHLCLVPWNTLSAFAREQVDQGEDPPLDILGVHVQRYSKITEPEKET